MEFFLFDEEKTVDDQPVIVRTGDLEHEFKVEIGFLELEVVAYVGNLKIVGYAHFSNGGRTTARRSSRDTTRPKSRMRNAQANLPSEGRPKPAWRCSTVTRVAAISPKC